MIHDVASYTLFESVVNYGWTAKQPFDTCQSAESRQS